MKRLTDFLKSHRKILIISCLLVVLIGLAFLLYGSKNKLSAVSANDVIRSETEVKLMRILSEIEGVGKAEVFLDEFFARAKPGGHRAILLPFGRQGVPAAYVKRKGAFSRGD